MLSLSPFKYSTGLHFEAVLVPLTDSQSYVLQFDATSFVSNYNVNLVAYFIPLIMSFFVLLYKLKNKHLPSRNDFAQQLYEVFLGETFFYITVFNLVALVSYSYLYYTLSSDTANFYHNLVLLFAIVFSIFSIFNYFFKPEIMGIFRSAFKTEG